MSDEERAQAHNDMEYAGEKLIDDTWGWLVARPQRTDSTTWLQTLEAYLNARERVKALGTAVPPLGEREKCTCGWLGVRKLRKCVPELLQPRARSTVRCDREADATGNARTAAISAVRL